MTNNTQEQKDPKRDYKGKKNSNIVNFPSLLRSDVFSPKQSTSLLDAPIVVARIVIKILNDISNDQFQSKKQPGQLALFDEEFLTEDNATASFTYHVSELDKHRNYKYIEKGLTFLENLDKKWHKSINSKGKTIKNLGGFIINPAYSEGKVTFRMTAYWIEKLLSLGTYNQMYFETAFKLNDMKQWLFYLWLAELQQPTKIKLATFNETWGYEYETAAEACRVTLRRTYAKAFDKYGKVSFICKPEGHLIHIIPTYPTKSTQIKLSSKTMSKQAISQKLAYWKQRHKLEQFHVDKFRFFISKDTGSYNIFLKAYNSLKEACREQNIKITSYTNDAFFNALQPHIDKIYSVSAFSNMVPNGQPKLIDDD